MKLRSLTLAALAGLIQFLNPTRSEAAVLYPASGGGITTPAATNTVVNIVTNTPAISNYFLSTITNNNGVFGIGKTNYYAIWNPNTNKLSYSILFSTNANGTDVGMKVGDNPDGSITLSLKLYANYVTEATRDWLDSKWSVANGDYEFMTDKGASGTARALTLGTGGVRYWTLGGAGVGIGDWLPVTSGTRSIGANSDGIKDIWVEGRVVMDTEGTAGIGQVGNLANGNGTGINFQGGTMAIVSTFNSADIFRFYAGGTTIGGVNRTALNLGYAVLTAGAGASTFGSFFGQDPFNTANRWQIGSNNIAATTQPPINQIVGTSGSGVSRYGGDLGIYGGLSTGSGTNGSLILGTAEGVASASIQNTPKIRYYLSPEPVILTESTATLVCTVSNITAGHFVTIKVFATTDADDATDFQSVGEEFVVAAVDKGGTVTTTVSASAPGATITSAGTLTTTWTAVANVNGFDLKNSAVSSLTQTTLKTRWRIEAIDSDVVPHIYDAGYRHL